MKNQTDAPGAPEEEKDLAFYRKQNEYLLEIIRDLSARVSRQDTSYAGRWFHFHEMPPEDGQKIFTLHLTAQILRIATYHSNLAQHNPYQKYVLAEENGLEMAAGFSNIDKLFVWAPIPKHLGDGYVQRLHAMEDDPGPCWFPFSEFKPQKPDVILFCFMGENTSNFIAARGFGFYDPCGGDHGNPVIIPFLADGSFSSDRYVNFENRSNAFWTLPPQAPHYVPTHLSQNRNGNP